MLDGTWVSVELLKALELGYKLAEITEVWHFENTVKYDPDTRQGVFFRNTWSPVKTKETAGIKRPQPKTIRPLLSSRRSETSTVPHSIDSDSQSTGSVSGQSYGSRRSTRVGLIRLSSNIKRDKTIALEKLILANDDPGLEVVEIEGKGRGV